MKTTTKNTGIKVNTNVKAGSLGFNNHVRTGLKVRSAIKAGTTICQKNHNSRLNAMA